MISWPAAAKVMALAATSQELATLAPKDLYRLTSRSAQASVDALRLACLRACLAATSMDLPLHVVLNPPLKMRNIVNSVPNSVLPHVLGRVKMNQIVALQSFQN